MHPSADVLLLQDKTFDSVFDVPWNIVEMHLQKP